MQNLIQNTVLVVQYWFTRMWGGVKDERKKARVLNLLKVAKWQNFRPSSTMEVHWWPNPTYLSSMGPAGQDCGCKTQFVTTTDKTRTLTFWPTEPQVTWPPFRPWCSTVRPKTEKEKIGDIDQITRKVGWSNWRDAASRWRWNGSSESRHGVVSKELSRFRSVFPDRGTSRRFVVMGPCDVNKTR